MQKYKIILSGTKGSGQKTLHETLRNCNGANESVEKKEKEAKLYFGKNTEVSIYRVNFQKKHGTFFNTLKKQSNFVGLMVLINCSKPNSFEEFLAYVSLFKEYDINNMVFGLTCAGGDDCHLNIEKVIKVIKNDDLVIPAFQVDVKKCHDIILMAESLIFSAGYEVF